MIDLFHSGKGSPLVTILTRSGKMDISARQPRLYQVRGWVIELERLERLFRYVQFTGESSASE